MPLAYNIGCAKPLTDMSPFFSFFFFVTCAAIVVAVLWQLLVSGQLVGAIKCRCFTQAGDTNHDARVLILRRGAEKSGPPTVEVQVRYPATIQSFLYTPDEARVLADMLEEAARKLDPR
jgi:hypothetical protein